MTGTYFYPQAIEKAAEKALSQARINGCTADYVDHLAALVDMAQSSPTGADGIFVSLDDWKLIRKYYGKE